MNKYQANPTNIAQYMKAGANILLIGAHGIGKTTILKQAAESLGWNIKILNGATIDPYIDLLGIPVASGENTDPVESRELQMIQKRDLLDADVVFIDEWNRAPKPTTNALMELINDHSLNGVPLPNLKCVVGAMNPPEDEGVGADYAVNLVDPAQVDRFHIIMSMSNRANKKVIRKALVGTAGKPREVTDKVADILVEWQRNLDFTSGGKTRAPYISPRRVERVGKLFLQFPQQSTLYHALGTEVENLNYESLYRQLAAVVGYSNEDPGEVSIDLPDLNDLVASILTHNETNTPQVSDELSESLTNAFQSHGGDPLNPVNLDPEKLWNKMHTIVGSDDEVFNKMNTLRKFLSTNRTVVPEAVDIMIKVTSYIVARDESS